jgi:hypothetical protein
MSIHLQSDVVQVLSTLRMIKYFNLNIVYNLLLEN